MFSHSARLASPPRPSSHPSSSSALSSDFSASQTQRWIEKTSVVADGETKRQSPTKKSNSSSFRRSLTETQTLPLSLSSAPPHSTTNPNELSIPNIPFQTLPSLNEIYNETMNYIQSMVPSPSPSSSSSSPSHSLSPSSLPPLDMDLSNMSPDQLSLFHHYRHRLSQLEIFHHSLVTLLTKWNGEGKGNEKTRLKYTILTLCEEVSSLQRAISDCQIFLYDERERLNVFVSENESLRSDLKEKNDKISNLLYLIQPIHEDVTYMKDMRPNVTVKYYNGEDNSDNGKMVEVKERDSGGRETKTVLINEGRLQQSKGKRVHHNNRVKLMAQANFNSQSSNSHSFSRTLTHNPQYSLPPHLPSPSPRPHHSLSSTSTSSSSSVSSLPPPPPAPQRIIRTIYLPHERITTLESLVTQLRTERDRERTLMGERVQSLMEDREIRESEWKKEKGNYQKNIGMVKKELDDVNNRNHMVLIEYMNLRQETLKNNTKKKEENIKLKNEIKKLTMENDKLRQEAKKEIGNLSNENTKLSQFIHYNHSSSTDNKSMIDGQHFILHQLYEDKIQYLQGRIGHWRGKYKKDKSEWRRRWREVEGEVNVMREYKKRVQGKVTQWMRKHNNNNNNSPSNADHPVTQYQWDEMRRDIQQMEQTTRGVESKMLDGLRSTSARAIPEPHRRVGGNIHGNPKSSRPIPQQGNPPHPHHQQAPHMVHHHDVHGNGLEGKDGQRVHPSEWNPNQEYDYDDNDNEQEEDHEDGEQGGEEDENEEEIDDTMENEDEEKNISRLPSYEVEDVEDDEEEEESDRKYYGNIPSNVNSVGSRYHH